VAETREPGKYHHDPDEGETRYPPEEGEQHGGRDHERDPHEPLNTPVDRVPDPVGKTRSTEGMGRPQKGDTNAP
jgi:hypothetical protein